MEYTEKIRTGKYILKIYNDPEPRDPREDDHITKMVCFNRRHTLGDKHDYRQSDYNSWDELKAAIEKQEKPAAILPLYLYDHGGISMKVGSFVGHAQHAEWDSGQVGFIFITKQTYLSNWGNGRRNITQSMREHAETILRSDVEVYTQYLEGDVYGFRLFEKTDTGKKEIDSCWGFFGPDWKTNGIKDHLPKDFIYEVAANLITDVATIISD